ncbi:MAG: glycosyltransferase family 4 protein [Saprospirales bacterium]|nr:glycosyltransferase family 4 protein [Saprospirales bacterium]
MKIAVNARFLLPGKLEGIGWYTYEVVRRMAEAHPEDEFWLLFDRPVKEGFRFGPNVRMMTLSPPARHPFLWLAWFEGRIPATLRRLGADVFFSPDNYCSLRSSTPTLLVMHDIAYAHFPAHIPWLSRQYYRFFVPRFLRRAERVLTVSEFTKQDLIRTLGVPGDKIRVAGNGPRKVFRPLPEDEKREIRTRFSGGEPYFLYVGAIHPRKNVPRLIRAFDLFKERTNAPHRLLLAGRWGWQTGEVKTAFEQARHQSAIHFMGYVDDDLLAGLMGAAFALTYVSLWEGFGLPVLEALFSEVPVIYGNATSLPEVAGDAGLAVDPESEESIAGGMAALVLDEGMAKQLVEKGRLQRQKFSWDHTARVVYEELKSLAREAQ